MSDSHSTPHCVLLLASFAIGCGESTDEISKRETSAAIKARKDLFQADPATFIMARHRPGEALYTWKILIDSSCDLDQVHIWTPYVAPVMRQIPYVIRGYPMPSEELRVFFEVDAEWYHGRDEVSGLQPTQEEVQCVKKLKELEERFHAAEASVPEAAQARFLMDPEAFRTWFQWGSGRVSTPYREPQIRQEADGSWIWEADGANCRDPETPGLAAECTRYTLHCPLIPDNLTPLEVPCEGTVVDQKSVSLENTALTVEE